MRITRRLAASFVAIGLATSMAACSGSADATDTSSAGGDESSAAGGDLRIGYMIWNTSVPFYSGLISKAEETADELGVELDIRNGGGELANEVAVVQQFVAEDFDMILISPSDPTGIVPAVKEANAAGIPVMAVNTMADTSSGAEIVTYVGVDDVEFGRLQGELLVDAIGETGTYAYIQGKLGTSAQLQRQQGLEEYLADYPGITRLSEISANWDNAQALAAIQDTLNRFAPGEIDAIVGQGPESVSGALNAKESGRTDVAFVLGDYPSDVRSAIQDGAVYGTVDQMPDPQGEQAVRYAYAWLTGDQASVPQPQAFIDMPLVTADNVEDVPAAWGE
ncbi:substrate-binding domain-containing protein [Actinotalea sp. M2MS4P-6]|uniref:sugar ABC transporter substrate-binding protein n=1 Tax=Actinotalea sp. M2MS4P-6 TaxID=2983762 RepID=UPI0021E47344|nr:sugar ABC transporter substrate-binding protein [Actinotalea sp. M2MS4P-6]MCV2394355.1 substrate-binding domain-containing protein [Actinotalea sp. M2MS4P-6]